MAARVWSRWRALRVLFFVAALLAALNGSTAVTLADAGDQVTTNALIAAPALGRQTAVAIGIYRPDLPDHADRVGVYERGLGHSLNIIAWYALWGGWKSGFSRGDLETVSSRGSLPLITWEPWAGQPRDPAWSVRSAILSGRSDPYIQSWARGLAQYRRPVFLRFAHEMHDQDYPWAVGVNGNTAADYVSAWKYVHDAFVREGATNVLWVWNPNTTGAMNRDDYVPLYSALYPGDGYVDWLGLDIFNAGLDVDWGFPRWRSLSDILTEPYAAITQVSSRPIMLAEVGSAEDGGSKADWMVDAMAALPAQFPAIRALTWFDVHKEAAWQLDSSAAALSAWTTASRSLGWATNRQLLGA